MSLSRHHQEHHENALRLTLDARKRVNLAKLLPKAEISSLIAYTEDNKIILEPMSEIPAHELWLHENPKALKKVKEGLKKKGKHYLGSFSKYVD